MEAQIRFEGTPRPSLVSALRTDRKSTGRSSGSSAVRFRQDASFCPADYVDGSNETSSPSVGPSRSSSGFVVDTHVRLSSLTARSESNVTATQPSTHSSPLFRQPRSVISMRFHPSLTSFRKEERFTDKIFRGMSAALIEPALHLTKKIEKRIGNFTRSRSDVGISSHSSRRLETMQHIFSTVGTVEARHHVLRGEALDRHPDEMRKGRCKAIARRFTNPMRRWRKAFFVVVCDHGPMSMELRFDWDRDNAATEHAFRRVRLSSVRAVTAAMLFEPVKESVRSREFRVVCTNFTLKLRAPTRESMKFWVTALPQLARQARGNCCAQNKLDADETLEKYVFRQIQKEDSDGPDSELRATVTKAEMEEIMDLLTMYASREYVAEVCAEFDPEGGGVLLSVEDLPGLFQYFAVKDAVMPSFERFAVELPAEPDWNRTLGRPRAMTSQSVRSKYGANQSEEDLRPSVGTVQDDIVRRSRGISAEGLRSFMQVEQGDRISESGAVEIMAKLREPHIVEVAGQRFLTETGFSQLLVSTSNTIFDLGMRSNVHQDMTQPLSHYWISCSHNTYLEADQLLGQSSLEQYMDVIFQRGCRCVEIDIHDGRDGEPIVKHGWTPTSSILFSEVVSVCKEYAFKASPYPLILSLEMHCGARQKARVGEVLSTILGEHLLRLPHDGGLAAEKLVSPEAAMYKVIVKGKVPHQVHDIWKDSFSSSTLFESEQDSLDGSDKETHPNCGRCHNFVTLVVLCLSRFAIWRRTQHVNCSERRTASSAMSSADRPLSKSSNSRKRASKPSKGASVKSDSGSGEGIGLKRQGVLDYARTLYLIAKKLSQGSTLTIRAAGFKPCNITSFNEKAAVKLVEKHTSDAVRNHNRLYLGRVYPNGTRFGSTNFDPMPMWVAGYQLVALNYQSHDISTVLNAGLFRHINGGSGYVLKPPLVAGRDPPAPDSPRGGPGGEAADDPDNLGCALEITVLSGHCLPKAPPAYGEGVLDPLVRVSTVGEAEDSWVGCTSRVEDNGINPTWSNWFSFKIAKPCVAMLSFEVCHATFDPEAANSFCCSPASADLQQQFPVVASTAYPLRSLRDGIRWVPLRDDQHRSVPHCGLLVEVRFVGPWAEWRRRQRTFAEEAPPPPGPPTTPCSYRTADSPRSMDVDSVVLDVAQDVPPQETCLAPVPVSCSPRWLLKSVEGAADAADAVAPKEECARFTPTYDIAI